MSSKIDFYELRWDTEYFGVSCAKAILYEPLNDTEWNSLSEKFREYQFVSIENRNSEPVNAQLIGKNTTAFLADINIQFAKKLHKCEDISDVLAIQNEIEYNEEIIALADFKYSKFTDDPDLLVRGGGLVYKQWLINSFGKEDKYFALNRDEKISGFLLHSYKEDFCTVELISAVGNRGIGSKLFKAVENSAFHRGCKEIRVGTQIRNTVAINFYNKLGCKQVCCNQIYNLWRI